MHRIALITAALGLAACSTSNPYQGGTYVDPQTARNVNCGAGVIGGAVVGGILGNQIGGGKGQDIATAAGATVGGLLGASRQECQQQQTYNHPAYNQPAYNGYQRTSNPVIVGYDQYGRPVYR
ncbi:glycine zipper 2TM domain-containing protein [Amaricoccus macauensis]|uniref:glycine zipper 2TM domain-containing protein n=1 Tax=Amaricoccus macauensis TaxID=57001 RepID=UPI003C7ADDF5